MHSCSIFTMLFRSESCLEYLIIIMKPVALECVLGSEAYHTHKVSDEKVDISKYDGDLEDDNYKIGELFNDTEPRLR